MTLDDDIAARLRTEARKSGVSFRVAVNEYLRAGLTQRRVPVAAPFRVEPVSLGAPLSGRSYDNIAALLKDIEDAAQ